VYFRLFPPFQYSQRSNFYKASFLLEARGLYPIAGIEKENEGM
jgi:hypothetical protein